MLGGLFRRYKGWNPVHPTGGAFWGIGVGLGCGVGWGPGFGPEAIGFVGAGCGLGFSVGLTLAGLGIGLPSGGLVSLPWNALVFTGQRASSVSSAVILPALMLAVQQSREGLSRQADAFHRGVRKLYGTRMPGGKTSLLRSQKGFTGESREAGGENQRHSKPVGAGLSRNFLPPASRDRKWRRDEPS